VLFRSNFLDNFHFYTLHISDINIVLTTHNHIDHNMDLSRIIDLQREFNQSKPKNDKLNIQFYLDKDTYTRSTEMLKISRSTSHLHELRPDHNYDDVTKKFHVKLSYFKTTHDNNLSDSVGLVLEFNDPDTENIVFKLGITSDTKYSNEISKRMSDCNAVIAHFSKTDENDLRGTERKKMLKNHLGYMGVREIFKNTIADLCIAAEWSGTLGDIRYELAELWKYDVKDTNKTIIPADIGFLFTIPEKKIRCTSCFNLVDKNKIRVGRPTVPFGRIMYYGPNCIS
jgi:hypothetical protein